MKFLLRRTADYVRECDKVLMLLCVLATSFGCVAVLSATYNAVGGFGQFITQVVGMVLGIVALIAVSTFNYRNFVKYWPFYVAISVGLVLLTFFFGYAPGDTDDKAWLKFAGLSFQPSELLKVAFVITFGYHVQKIGDNIKKFFHVVLLTIHGAIPVMLIHLQGDDGTALVFAVMFVCMMFVAGVKKRYFIAAGVAVAVAAPFLYFFVMNDDQKSRIYSLLFPTQEDYLGVLWQQWRGRIALANGGIFGKGLFKGPLVQAGNIPEGYNDFIFSSIGEELGFIGCLAVIVLLCAICIRILRIAHLSNDKLGTTMCVGIFAMFAAQIVINIGMNLSLIPVIGVTLPLFSAGGTSLVSIYLGLGLVMSVYMHRQSQILYLRDEY